MKKFARRAVALLLAALLVAALPLNVSAASFYDWKDIGGYEYYVSLNCSTSAASAATETNCTTTKVSVELFVYNASDELECSISNNNKTISASTSLSFGAGASYATSKHYVDGSQFYSARVSAS